MCVLCMCEMQIMYLVFAFGSKPDSLTMWSLQACVKTPPAMISLFYSRGWHING